jgi:oxygen-independent coproporphyrinogen-3 oxidase
MEPISVYVHFPWCLKKCPYCDFVSFAEIREQIDHRGYADAVIAELSARRAALEGRPLRSVFFGGGTPSLWEPDELGRVLGAVLDAVSKPASKPDGEEVEITVECNPTSLDEERARALKGVGVNRLSVGVQGLDERRLKFLGRLHGPDEGLEALRAALRSGMPRVSGDLIYGAHGAEEETAAEAASEARAVAETGVSHVSAYSLTIEPGTQFGELARRGKLPIAKEDTLVESFLAVEAALEGAGFEHYEISNYARPGHESRHNLGYWLGLDYLGLGCGAFGTLGDRDGSAVRYRNKATPQGYMQAAAAGSSTEESDERLDPETRLRERIMLGLRLRAGLDLEAAAGSLGIRAFSDGRRRAVERLAKAGRIEVEGSRVRIPKQAWVFADGIAAELF